MPIGKNEMLEEFNEWILFVDLLTHHEEELWNRNLQEGKWSIREIVSHIMLWDKYFLEEGIDKIYKKAPLTLQHLDFDEFNNKAKVYGLMTSVQELSKQAVYYRDQIINHIKSFSDKEYLTTYMDGDGTPFTVTQYLKDFIGHDQHHMFQMKIAVDFQLERNIQNGL